MLRIFDEPLNMIAYFGPFFKFLLICEFYFRQISPPKYMVQKIL